MTEKIEKIFELSMDEKDLMKCDFSDDYLRRRHIDLKDNISLIFRCFMRINKHGKVKEQKNKNLFTDSDLEEIKIRYFDIRYTI